MSLLLQILSALRGFLQHTVPFSHKWCCTDALGFRRGGCVAVANWNHNIIKRKSVVIVCCYLLLHCFWYVKTAFPTALPSTLTSDNCIKKWLLRFPAGQPGEDTSTCSCVQKNVGPWITWRGRIWSIFVSILWSTRQKKMLSIKKVDNRWHCSLSHLLLW